MRVITLIIERQPTEPHQAFCSRLCSRRLGRGRGIAFRPIWRSSTGTSDCRCKSTTQHKHRHVNILGRYRNRAASHVHIRVEHSGYSNRREPAAHGDAYSEATSKDLASECHIANKPRGRAVQHMRRKGGCSSCSVVLARFGDGRRRVENPWCLW